MSKIWLLLYTHFFNKHHCFWTESLMLKNLGVDRLSVMLNFLSINAYFFWG